MVMEVVQEDMSEGSMQCTEHPFKNSTPAGGICAFCLQEKLGKLVSSSFSVAIYPSAAVSSSSSPSFRSDITTTTTTINPSSLPLHHPNNPSAVSSTNYHSRRAKLPFLLTQRKKKKKEAMIAAADGSSIVFKRSKTTTSTRNASLFMEDYDSEDYSHPQRKGFWSFFYLHSTTKKSEGSNKVDMSALGDGNLIRPRERKREELVVVDESESPDQERKVSRSRSVGCGSRSFSGDFLERISTGFGDCSTLRRVESHREGNNKPRIHSMLRNNDAASATGVGGQDCIKERVKCGGIFSGFIITSTSSSSSSSNEDTSIGKKNTTTTTPGRSHNHVRNLVQAHARSKSWGWAFASPMRAFSKPSTSASGKRKSSTNINNVTPNLAAIPSLLTARG